MRLSYKRVAVPLPREWDRTYECWRVRQRITLHIHRDGVEIGTATVESKRALFRRHGRMEYGNPFLSEWKIQMPDRAWTMPGVYRRERVLSHIRQHLTR